MKTSNIGIELIKKYEGCVLKAYKCPSGVWTIGYGHTNGISNYSGSYSQNLKLLNLLKQGKLNN